MMDKRRDFEKELNDFRIMTSDRRKFMRQSFVPYQWKEDMLSEISRLRKIEDVLREFKIQMDDVHEFVEHMKGLLDGLLEEE